MDERIRTRADDCRKRRQARRTRDEDWEKVRALVEMSIEPRRAGKDAAAFFRRALPDEWLELRAAAYT
jgi:hypothetical protein